jgi:Mg2+ and Co2+ transporter CorA
MDDAIKEFADELKSKLFAKQDKYKTEVYDSQWFTLEQKYLNDYSFDAIQVIRTISFYSTRAGKLYDNFLTIRASDDLLQSIEPCSFDEKWCGRAPNI